MEVDIQVPSAPLLAQFLVPVSGKAADTTQAHGTLLPMWEAWMKFLASGFSLAQSFRRVNQTMNNQPISLSPSSPHFLLPSPLPFSLLASYTLLLTLLPLLLSLCLQNKQKSQTD